METQKYTVKQDPNRKDQKLLLCNDKNFYLEVHKTFDNISCNNYRYDFFPISQDGKMFPKQEDWLKENSVIQQDVDEAIKWYLISCLGYKELNYTIFYSEEGFYFGEYYQIKDAYEFLLN